MPAGFSTLLQDELKKGRISNAEFVRISIPGTEAQGGPEFFFSNSYKSEIVDGYESKTWTPLGGLVSVSGHQRDLSVTSFDTSVNLIGVDESKLGLILDAGIKGSLIRIYRGFYDASGNLIEAPSLRYTGVVTSYSLGEDRVENIDAFTLTINCSSYKTVLENRIAGRYTNPKSFNPDGLPSDATWDSSMDRVPGLVNAKFDFGKKLA